jgi:hypothetical protein
MSRRIGIAALAVLLVLLPACAKKVLAPPRVDLGGWRTIGIVEFSGGGNPELGVQATQEFMEAVHYAQPGVRILELGTQDHVLAEVDSAALDFEAVRALRERYGVDAVFVGRVELGHVKPNLRFGQSFASMEARADLQGEIAARLLETGSGATVWSRTASASRNVARVGVPSTGLPSFGAADPNDLHAGLVRQLVANVSGDFYSHWVKQR